MDRKNTIYINSIGKRITMEEFKSHCYKVGHVYRINKCFYNKCVGFENDRPVLQSFFISFPEFGRGLTDIHVSKRVTPMPSLDFVNKIMSGEIVEVDACVFDNVVSTFTSMAESFSKVLGGSQLSEKKN